MICSDDVGKCKNSYPAKFNQYDNLHRISVYKLWKNECFSSWLEWLHQNVPSCDPLRWLNFTRYTSLWSNICKTHIMHNLWNIILINWNYGNKLILFISTILSHRKWLLESMNTPLTVFYSLGKAKTNMQWPLLWPFSSCACTKCMCYSTLMEHWRVGAQSWNIARGKQDKAYTISISIPTCNSANLVNNKCCDSIIFCSSLKNVSECWAV